MELAIPILALGGMYLVSNQNKKNNGYDNSNNNDNNANVNANVNANANANRIKESFLNAGQRVNQQNVLPNTNIPTTNYPVMLPNTGSNVNAYAQPNAVTDKYYNSSVGQRVLQNPDQFGNSYNPNTNSDYIFNRVRFFYFQYQKNRLGFKIEKFLNWNFKKISLKD